MLYLRQVISNNLITMFLYFLHLPDINVLLFKNHSIMMNLHIHTHTTCRTHTYTHTHTHTPTHPHTHTHTCTHIHPHNTQNTHMHTHTQTEHTHTHTYKCIMHLCTFFQSTLHIFTQSLHLWVAMCSKINGYITDNPQRSFLELYQE